MMLGSSKTVTARKRHWCSWCSEDIPAGTSYIRYAVAGDDGVGTVKIHPECNAACGRAFAEDPSFEAEPGVVFTRGCTCEHGDVGHGTYPTCTKDPYVEVKELPEGQH